MLGTCSAPPRAGPMKDPNRRVLSALLVAFVLSVALGATWLWSSSRVVTHSETVARGRTIAHEFDALFVSLDEMQEGVSAFLLSGGSDALAPFVSGQASAKESIASLAADLGDDPEQTLKLREVELLLEQEVAQSTSALELRRVDADTEAQRSNDDERRRTAESLRAVLRTMRERQRTVSAARLAALVASTRFASDVVLLATGINAILLLGVALLVARAARQSRRAREEMRAARDAAIEADRFKSAFLANMSHEIRTPLNGVIGMTDLLLTTRMTREQREMARTLRTTGETLLALVNDVLDFSKLEANRVELEAQPFDLSRLLRDVIALARAQADAKSLPISLVVDPDVPGTVVADAFRLRQVLLNLLSNAVKFTSHGGVRLAVSAGAPSSAGSHAFVFAVEDTGIGIAATARGRLFEAFTQADVSTTREYGGTGLGLAISARLVDRMGGRIEVESEPGRGSTFRVHVGIRSAPSAGPSPAEEQLPDDGAAAARHPLSVLLAEDNPTNQRVTLGTLARFGYSADLVDNGLAAVEAVERTAYDLVLMDVQMPVLDGLAASRRIRASCGHAAGPYIIALTASAFRRDRESCLAAGANDYVAKPLRADELLRALLRCPTRGTAVPKAREVQPAPDLHAASLDRDALANLRALTGGTPGSVSDLVDTFLTDTPARLEALRCAEDPEVLRRTAHSLKSSSAYFGAARLCSLLGELEQASLRHGPPFCQPIVAAIGSEFARVKTALERDLRQGARGCP